MIYYRYAKPVKGLFVRCNIFFVGQSVLYNFKKVTIIHLKLRIQEL